jgi:hypothetical protein
MSTCDYEVVDLGDLVVTDATPVVAGPPGPPGPPGPGGGSGGYEYEQSTPAATWIIAVPVDFERTPAVSVYVGGELVFTDVTADETTVTIEFPSPTAGLAVLT